MASIAPSERLRRELQEIVAGAGDEDDPIERRSAGSVPG